MKYLIEFQDIQENNTNLFGGKGSNLVYLTSHNIRVPKGWILPAQFFHENVLKNCASVEEIRLSIEAFTFPEDFYADITQLPDLVSVRSSANMEDGKNYSFAGVFQSFLYVTPEDVEKNIKLCWSSLYSDRALQYTLSQGWDILKQSMSVVVQSMIDSDVSGVMFTEDPFDEDLLLIEAIPGVGEDLVHGNVTPDVYKVNRDEGYIDSVLAPIRDNRYDQCLTGDQIQQLAREGIEIEKLYGEGQDIEWAIKDSILYILQSRPITSKI